MMKHSARLKKQNENLNQALVYKSLKKLLPKANDYFCNPDGYIEELEELKYFGVNTVKELQLLIKKHRKRILEIDKSPMNNYHKKMYREEMGLEAFNNLMKKRIWFAFPALLRLALELEFGEKYQEFSRRRDEIEQVAQASVASLIG